MSLYWNHPSSARPKLPQHHLVLQMEIIVQQSKCATTHFSLSSFSPSPYFINGYPIQSVDKHKDLGIMQMVCNKISWSDYIGDICAKAYKSLHLIHQSIPFSPSNVRICLYLSFVHSMLSYYNLSYGDLT